MAENHSTGLLKRCACCETEKPATAAFFHRHAASADGWRPQCKECRKAESRAYYLANAERIRANSKRWQAANPEKANAKKLAWVHRHEEREKQRRRDWKERNRVALRAREAARLKERERTDPAFHLRRLMSRRMWMALRHAKDGWSWEALVGYTRYDLMAHLERQFTKGMTWDKFAAGEIHIDHILPVASFNCASPDDPDFKVCWALSNLRPMWATENMSKGAKVLTLL